MTAAAVQIAGLGACTPIGRNAWSSAAAARAGVCGFGEHPFMIDSAGEPMRVARAPWIAADVDVPHRCAALLLPAIEEAVRPLAETDAAASCRLGLALAVPPLRAGQPAGLRDAMLLCIAQRHHELFEASKVFEVGHAGGHLALDAAVRGCAGGSIDACVVCGVDTYLAPETLEWIEAGDQLHGGGVLNNPWGFIPGEAAGAVLVISHEFAARTGMTSLAVLGEPSVGLETRLIKSGDVCIGEGLTQAFRGALKSLEPGDLVHNVFCDMNGETYRADEYGFTVLRTKEYFRNATDFVAPADCWGDVGAAGMPLHIALAVISHLKHYSKGPVSMVWASSESGERGAVLVRSFEPRDG
jgi:3-oxoacyl-[acyl-carrier-protein] synthase-1